MLPYSQQVVRINSSDAEVVRYCDNICTIKRKCLMNTLKKTENRLDFKEQHMSV